MYEDKHGRDSCVYCSGYMFVCVEHECLYSIDATYYCNLRRPMSLSNSQNLVCYKVLLFFNMLPGTVNICKNCMLCREWCVELARK